MGGTSWSDDTATVISKQHTTKSAAQIFTSKSTKKEMSPTGVKFREARDSDVNPRTTPVAVYLDVTGSMGRIPEHLVKGNLSALMSTMLAHNVSYPAIMFGAIGDHYYDKSYLQVGQYESGPAELDLWLTSIHIEMGGGGQNMESYLMAWLFAARHTSLDSFEKRGEKGFLFTIGDEATHPVIEADKLRQIMGYGEAQNLTAEQLLEEVQRTHHVFHIHINEADHKNDQQVFASWRKLLGERFIVLEDHNAVAETIATTVAVMNGANLAAVTSGMSASTGKTVALALSNIGGLVQGDSSSTGALKL